MYMWMTRSNLANLIFFNTIVLIRRYKYFEKTACLNSVDGSMDAKTNLEGLKGYVILPPLLVHDEISLIKYPLPEPADNPEDLQEIDARTESKKAIVLTMLKVKFWIKNLWIEQSIFFMASGIEAQSHDNTRNWTSIASYFLISQKTI